jgi:hypothetical protein
MQSNVSTGPHKVKYHGTGEDWDTTIENEKGVDVSLVLPQHRARTQPLNYRMNMFVTSEGDIKAKVVSNSSAVKAPDTQSDGIPTVPSNDLTSMCIPPPSRVAFYLRRDGLATE